MTDTPAITLETPWWPIDRCVKNALAALIAGATMLSPLLAEADGRHVLVVIVPPARQPSPPPQIFPPQPALQWAPPLPLGLTPGRRSPPPRCYADTHVCPVTRPEDVGGPCTCDTKSGPVGGRALIPPSRDVTDEPPRNY
jgi:hypothetical protein